MEPEELPSSELGTKEYWDATYQVEIQNFKTHGDVGEIWFGEDNAFKVIRWLNNTDLVSKDDPIIDLGCGNGMMLIELAVEGFSDLTGVDYSSQAVELAKSIAEEKGLKNIKYLTCDIVGDSMDLSGYAVVLDKGTYDAVGLNPENTKAHRKAYKANLKKLLKNKGLFVITSCNWTEEELRLHFESDFEIAAIIPTPTFQFGGIVGSSVTTIVFQKRLEET